MAKYNRAPRSVDTTTKQEDLLKRYENMLNSVAVMFDEDGPIYSTWIYFQIGLNDKNSVVFNSSSVNKKQNLIAQLHIDKTCSGVTNSFKLVVQYDPFNYGQNTTDEIDILETFIADAMAENFEDDDLLKGKIQYGYNSTSSNNLVSPLYTFFLTGASSDVRYDSGITTYTFTGVSILASDCDFTASFPAIENKKLMEVVVQTLYKWYGDPKYPPAHVEGVIPEDNNINYRIDIPEYLFDDSITIDYNEVTSNTMSPFMYCKQLLDDNPLTETEKNSEEYSEENLAKLSINKRPRYSMYITDVDGAPTIHVSHFAPSSIKVDGTETAVESAYLQLKYTFSWGKKNRLSNRNIVIGWNPEVDLRLYLIQKAQSNRLNKLYDLYVNNPNNPEYKAKYEKYASDIQSDVIEMYNAELKIIGIPADPPLGAEVRIIPQILERESRTSGIYMIVSASDNIDTNGTFVSTLNLFRQRGLDTNVTGLTASTKTDEVANKNEPTSLDVVNNTKVNINENNSTEYTDMVLA